MITILVIEDDPAIRTGLEVGLREDGYDILLAGDGLTGLKLASGNGVSLVLLDIMLPGKDGLEVCRQLRSDGVNTPVLMLTSKSDEVDKILGLEIGADDYMTKPFSMRELKARIKALLRRTSEYKKGIEQLAFGDVSVDFLRQEATKAGTQIRMSAKEYQILKFFVENEGHVVTRDALLDKVWGYDVFPTTRTVDNYVLSIRKKIEATPSNPVHLLTMHTSGYKFVR